MQWRVGSLRRRLGARAAAPASFLPQFEIVAGRARAFSTCNHVISGGVVCSRNATLEAPFKVSPASSTRLQEQSHNEDEAGLIVVSPDG